VPPNQRTARRSLLDFGLVREPVQYRAHAPQGAGTGGSRRCCT
jgi:hypothetical protein